MSKLTPEDYVTFDVRPSTEEARELEAERDKLRAEVERLRKTLEFGYKACKKYSTETESCRHSAVAELNFWPRLDQFLQLAEQALRGGGGDK
jgi:hypothetical protein